VHHHLSQSGCSLSELYEDIEKRKTHLSAVSAYIHKYITLHS